MDESTKIADLTVAEFRALMQECFDADRKALIQRENEKFARLQQARNQGIPNFYQGINMPANPANNPAE